MLSKVLANSDQIRGEREGPLRDRREDGHVNHALFHQALPQRLWKPRRMEVLAVLSGQNPSVGRLGNLRFLQSLRSLKGWMHLSRGRSKLALALARWCSTACLLSDVSFFGKLLGNTLIPFAILVLMSLPILWAKRRAPKQVPLALSLCLGWGLVFVNLIYPMVTPMKRHQ